MLNLFLVWSATGIWHGASWNYLIWGLFFFTILIFEKLWFGKILKNMSVFWQHSYTIFVLLISWTIFAIEDFSVLCSYFKVMFGLQNVPVWNPAVGYYLSNYGVILSAAIFFSTPVSKRIWENISDKMKQILTVCLLVLVLVVCTAYLVASTYNPFLYFRF